MPNTHVPAAGEAMPTAKRMTKRVAARADSIIEDALRENRSALMAINGLAKYLAEVMHELHGGQWSIDINHRSCFIMVARDGELPSIDQSSLRRAV